MPTRESSFVDPQLALPPTQWNVVAPKDIPVIAVIGASGVSTTAALLRATLRAAGLRVFGSLQSLDERADRLTPRDRVVLIESWPLRESIPGLSVLALTGLAADELPPNVALAAYTDACRRLAALARDVVVVNADDAQALAVASGSGARLRRVSLENNGADAIVREGEIILTEDGIRRRAGLLADSPLGTRPFATDLLVAAATALEVGAGAADVRRAAGRYRAPPDHLEVVASMAGVVWVNDAAATRPGRTAAVLEGASEPVVLIAGGEAGDQPLRRWSHCAASSARRVLLYGAGGAAMARALASIDCVEKVVRCADLDDAVDIARRVAVPGDIVVLSPGCAPEGRKPGPRFRHLIGRLEAQQEAA